MCYIIIWEKLFVISVTNKVSTVIRVFYFNRCLEDDILYYSTQLYCFKSKKVFVVTTNYLFRVTKHYTHFILFLTLLMKAVFLYLLHLSLSNKHFGSHAIITLLTNNSPTTNLYLTKRSSRILLFGERITA